MNNATTGLIQALRDRTARAHTYGMWIAEVAKQPSSHTDSAATCASPGCREAREALAAAEWSDTRGCAGMSMGDPHPLHLHPACPACGGVEPGQEGNCWRAEAVGHREDCKLVGGITPRYPIALPELGD